METRKIPERMCMLCRCMKPKKDMVRIVNTDDGIVVDISGKMNGRGCYLCTDENCINKISKMKTLNKLLKREVTEEEKTAIINALKERKINEQ